MEAGEVVTLLVVAVIFSLIVASRFLWARQVNRRLREAGEALGLAPFGPAGRAMSGDDRPMRGDHAGRLVQLRLFTIGAGRSNSTYHALEVALPGVDPAMTLRVQREGLGSKLAKSLGGQDIPTGNPSFDEAYRIQSNEPGKARAALDLATQDAILRLPEGVELRLGPCVEDPDGHFRDARGVYRSYASWGSAPGLDLARNASGPKVAVLRWSRLGTSVDPEALRAALPPLLQVAEAVERAAPRP